MRGFLRTALAVPKIKTGDIGHNVNEIVRAMEKSEAAGTDIMIFPSGCLTGVTEELLGQDFLTEEIKAACDDLARASAFWRGMFVVGTQYYDNETIYDSAIIFRGGSAFPVIDKPDSHKIYRVGDFSAAIIFRHDTALIRKYSEMGASIIIDMSRESFIYGKGRDVLERAKINSRDEAVAIAHSGPLGYIAECGAALLQSEASPADLSLRATDIDMDIVAAERKIRFAGCGCADTIPVFFIGDASLREAPLSREISMTPFIPERTPKQKDFFRECLSIMSASLADLINRWDRRKIFIRTASSANYALALVLCEMAGRLTEVEIVTVKQKKSDSAKERGELAYSIAEAERGFVICTEDLTDIALGNIDTPYMSDCRFILGGAPKTLVRELLTFAEENAFIGEKQRKLLAPYLDNKIPELSRKDQITDFFLYYSLKYGFAPEKLARLARRAFIPRVHEDVIFSGLLSFYSLFIPNGFKLTSRNIAPLFDFPFVPPRGAAAEPWLRATQILNSEVNDV